MAGTVTILSPLDVKPGSIDPSGRVVESAKMYVSHGVIVIDAKFTDETSSAFMWPSGSGWVVDGRTGA